MSDARPRWRLGGLAPSRGWRDFVTELAILPSVLQQAAALGIHPTVIGKDQVDRVARAMAANGLCRPLTFSRELRP